MKRKKDKPKKERAKTDLTGDTESWQIDPLADYKNPGKNDKEQTENEKEDAKKGNGPMGFDEWSVSWP